MAKKTSAKEKPNKGPGKANSLKSALDRLEKSPEYLGWRKTDPSSFLAHFFYMESPEEGKSVQIGYYNAERERMTTFEVSDAGITVQPELEVLKKDDVELLPLDREVIGFDCEEILRKADAEQASKYPGAPVFRRFFILQKLDIGQVYNVTLFTQTFKTLNFKFDAKSGELLKHHMDTLIQMGK